MSNVRRTDYDKIVKTFNESGKNAAFEYIKLNFGVKYPRDVITRIKKSPGYSYDAVSKKIIINNDISEKSIFIGIDELCNPSDSIKLNTVETSYINDTKDFTLEVLYQELMQEKFVELTKYVKLNRYLNKIYIDKTALIANGYKVAIN